MATLQDIASVLRSKNAGPFQVTLDILFADRATCRRLLDAGILDAQVVAGLYGVPAQQVSIIPFERANAIKVTIPRTAGRRGSGSAFDRDVYGAQQHGPLGGLECGFEPENSQEP